MNDCRQCQAFIRSHERTGCRLGYPQKPADEMIAIKSGYYIQPSAVAAGNCVIIGTPKELMTELIKRRVT